MMTKSPSKGIPKYAVCESCQLREELLDSTMREVA